MKLVIVSGLSGAGKTVALRQYEDQGWYCIDNIPLALVSHMALRALKNATGRYDRLAIGIDARESPEEILKFPRYLEKMRERGVDVRVVFLTTNENILLQRYAETRRKHPLSDDNTSLLEAIARERALLAPISDIADSTLDTSNLNLYELRDKILKEIPGGGAGKLTVTLMSFGFKNGAPVDADYVFDVRCLPNPHWETSIRHLTGKDDACVAWLERHREVRKMLSDIRQFLDQWLPEYTKQDRAYLTVAIGCTGGKHRSVYIVERLATTLKSRFDHLSVRHRELWSGDDKGRSIKK